ncbi:MAG: class I tRNA ligase family protein, partial [bacterium]
KSKGNVVDPLKMMEKYGTDAFRFSLVAPKTDSPYLRFSENRLRGCRNFANKIWNASRFTLMNLTDFTPEGRIDDLESLKLCDKWILGRFFSLVNDVTQHLDHYRFSEAANSLYQFFWGEFCDWYIELVKPRLLGKEGKFSRYTAQWILHYVLRGTLKLLHPFMPFITEDIYQRLPRTREQSIMISDWPVTKKKADSEVEEKMNLLMQIIQEARTVRSEMRIAPQKRIDLYLKSPNQKKLNFLRENRSLIVNLVRTEKLTIGEKIAKPSGSISSLVDDIDIFIPLEPLIDANKERKRLKKNLETIEKELRDLEKKLLSQDFLRKAPPEIVRKEKAKSSSIRSRAEKLKRILREIQTI